MQYDFIGIEEQVINGIKCPMLTLVGTITKKKYKFKVLADGKEIEYFLDEINEKNRFTLMAPFNRKIKRIEVYVIISGKKYLVCDLKSKLGGRICRKIKNSLFHRLKYIKAVIITILKGIKFFWKEYHFLVPIKMWKKYFRHFLNRVEERGVKIFNNPFDKNDYNDWIKKFEKSDYPVKSFKYNPLISILIPVYNIEKKYLSKCLDSILEQTYENYEVCIADDCSTNKETLKTLKEYEEKTNKIKVIYRKENGHISKATNSALEISKGEFIALMDDDDELAPDALYEVVKVLNENKNLDFIYTDEDKLDLNGNRCEPNFKPDWSPDTLLSLNYICHLSVIRKKIVDEVGGFQAGLEGAQDYDLLLKVTEKTNAIHHIPKILYHWRMVEGSTSMTINNKSYAIDKGKIALENALKRRNIKGMVEKDEISTYYRIKYTLKREPLVSIIIPTKDYADVLGPCLNSVYSKTKYKNYEVIVVNNNSEKKETFDLFDEYKRKYKNFKIIDANYDFNYSKINNMAVQMCDGEYVCLLNNDTEIISGDWLNVMVGYASQKHIGTVGPKLLYPDDTVQHAGIILGLGGVASHAYIGALRDECGMYGRLRVPYNYAGVTAACLVVEKKKYLEVGMLEESLKVAYNDVDFNIKLLDRGYYNVCLPQVEVYHFESKSRGLDTTPEKLKRFNDEQKFMYKKWNDIIKKDPFYNKNFSNKGWFMLDVDPTIDKNRIYNVED